MYCLLINLNLCPLLFSIRLSSVYYKLINIFLLYYFGCLKSLSVVVARHGLVFKSGKSPYGYKSFITITKMAY